MRFVLEVDEGGVAELPRLLRDVARRVEVDTMAYSFDVPPKTAGEARELVAMLRNRHLRNDDGRIIGKWDLQLHQEGMLIIPSELLAANEVAADEVLAADRRNDEFLDRLLESLAEPLPAPVPEGKIEVEYLLDPPRMVPRRFFRFHVSPGMAYRRRGQQFTIGPPTEQRQFTSYGTYREGGEQYMLAVPSEEYSLDLEIALPGMDIPEREAERMAHLPGWVVEEGIPHAAPGGVPPYDEDEAYRALAQANDEEGSGG